MAARLANPDNRDKITFEADILANDAVDLSIKIPLTERVGVHPRTAGHGHDVQHYPEPVMDADGAASTPRELWLDGVLIASW